MKSGDIPPPFLISALEESCQLRAPATLTPVEKAPGTHCIGGWMQPKMQPRHYEG
jgi:hypothetical protein